ncbi:hypothetical protein J1N35_032441 [Gossypium stocksii]|uniref:Uncharacterized protein n=1 Tax=Gossypium stocksii TaxID=47602 RepID=A0A9D3V4F5_9ROSI|nr:hypothetical protein J1N35_032441 [Gossypium stocksii]
MIPKISVLQLQDQKSDSDTDYSISNSSSDLSPESESESLSEEEENPLKVLQTHPKIEHSDDEEMEEVPESSSSQRRSTHRSSLGRTTFTLDDIPQKRWPDRIQEFHSWLETHKLTEVSNYNILMDFVSRFTGMLKDWWNSVTQHDQIQFLVLQDLAQPIRVIHHHFVGNPDDVLTFKRREFHKRKCCSYDKEDLSRSQSKSEASHFIIYPRSSSSCSQSNTSKLTVGEIQQEVFIALEDICNRRKIFKDYLHNDKRIDRAYVESHLKLKCPKDKLCDCRSKKKRRSKKYSFPKNTKWRKKKKPQWRYLRKKKEKIYDKKDCNGVIPVSVPNIPVKIYLDKYSKPITIIAFIDTGVAETIMNPDVLPQEWWKPHVRPSSSSSPFPTSHPIVPNLNPEFSPEVMNLAQQKTFHQKTKDMMFEYQIQLVSSSDTRLNMVKQYLRDKAKCHMHKPYHKEILKAIQEYYENILDPSEWSQDYPWYCSQINLNKIRLQDEQEDKIKYEEGDNHSESSVNSAQFPHSNANKYALCLPYSYGSCTSEIFKTPIRNAIILLRIADES